MISLVDFEGQMETLSHLCGFVVKRVAVTSFYNAIKHEKKENLAKGLELMTEDPPSKLTLKTLRYFIYQTKTHAENPDWIEKPCSVKGCSMGTLAEKFVGRSYSFRCTKCNSSRLKILPIHTEENVRLAEEHAKGGN